MLVSPPSLLDFWSRPLPTYRDRMLYDWHPLHCGLLLFSLLGHGYFPPIVPVFQSSKPHVVPRLRDIVLPAVRCHAIRIGSRLVNYSNPVRLPFFASFLRNHLPSLPCEIRAANRFPSSAKSQEVYTKLRRPNCLTHYWHTGYEPDEVDTFYRLVL